MKMTTIVKEAKELYEINCSICESVFQLPKVLPCLHSFCHKCLQGIVEENSRSFACPKCHIDVEIPTKGIVGFQTNSVINNMLTVLTVHNPTNCTNCDDEACATSRCLDCVENLCLNCVTAHARIRHTKGHKIISFEELQNNVLHEVIQCPSFCKIHEREILKYFCDTCDGAICRECAIYEHREHTYEDLKEAVKVHRSSVNDLLDECKKKIPVLHLALKEITEVHDSLLQRKSDVADHINENIDGYQRKLEEKRETLLENLQAIFIEKEAVLTEQKVALEMDLKNMLSSCGFVDNMMCYGNDAELMAAKRLMVKRLEYINACEQQLEPEENDVIEFIQDDESLEEAIRQFGTLNSAETFPSYCYIEEGTISKAKLGQRTTHKLITLDRLKRFVFKGGDNVTAKLTDPMGIITKLPVNDNENGTYNIECIYKSNDQHLLSVFIREKPIKGSPFEIEVSSGIEKVKIGPLLTQFGSGGVLKVIYDDQYEPWGIAHDGVDRIFVADHNSHKIQVFDCNGKLLCQFGSRGKENGDLWYPTGVAVNPKNKEIFVADHGNHRIQVFHADGIFLRTFCVRGSNAGELKGPCGVAIDQYGRLVVADRDNHRMQLFDSIDGKFLLQFGSHGSNEGQFISPRHVAITTANQILVSDSNNYRIQKFDERGYFLTQFGTKGTQPGQFMCPSGIAVDIENNIVVADYKNLSVQLLDESGKFIKYIGNEEEKKLRQVSKPTGVCITANGNVLVADRGTHKVHIY